MIFEVLRWLSLIVLVVSGVYGIYQVLISLYMFGQVKPLAPVSGQTHRFAVLVCAKDEENVIGQLLSSLKKQHYPANAFDVFVTADNCTDRTAAIARAAGAIVYKRCDPEHKGKGYALNWFFARFLQDYDGRYDACVIFDADNVADKEFLAAMNRQLNAGHSIAAGYRMGKNPSSSWVAGTSTLFWLMQTRCFFIPRSRLNLPCCSVGGTGFMFNLSVLSENGWNTSSVCEDIEFTLNSIADGHFVAFSQDAIFYDEQPLTFAQSLKQRYRWSLGSLQILSISTPRLLRALRSGKWRVLDAILFSLGVLVTGLSGICWVLYLLFTAVISYNFNNLWVTLGISMLGGYASIAFFACLILFLEKKHWPGVWKAILTFPIYLFSSSVINVLVLFYRDSVWYSIPHTVSISIEDVENVEELK